MEGQYIGVVRVPINGLRANFPVHVDAHELGSVETSVNDRLAPCIARESNLHPQGSEVSACQAHIKQTYTAYSCVNVCTNQMQYR